MANIKDDGTLELYTTQLGTYVTVTFTNLEAGKTPMPVTVQYMEKSLRDVKVLLEPARNGVIVRNGKDTELVVLRPDYLGGLHEVLDHILVASKDVTVGWSGAQKFMSDRDRQMVAEAIDDWAQSNPAAAAISAHPHHAQLGADPKAAVLAPPA